MSGEVPVKRDFQGLSAAEKVRAVLGAVFEPISRQNAVELSGIDLSTLSDKQKQNLDQLFLEEDVQTVNGEERGKFMLNANGRITLTNEVDMKTVHKQISSVLEKDLGFDL